MSNVYFSSDQGATWLGEDDFGMVLQPGNENDLAGPVDDVIAPIAGMVGAVQFPSVVGPRPLVVPLAFPFATTKRDMQAKARVFTAFLFGADGFPRDLWLRYDYDPDKYYTVRYTGSAGLERQLTLGFARVPFIARDPRKYLTDNAGDITLDSLLMLDSGLRLDDVFSFTVTSNRTVEVNNFGDLTARPVLQLTGSFTTLAVSIGGKTLVYGEALAAGTLTIDCAKYSAKLVAINKNNKVSGDWLELAPGINNVTFTGTGMNFMAAFIFRPVYN